MSQVFDIAEQFSKLAKDQGFLPVSLALAWVASVKGRVLFE